MTEEKGAILGDSEAKTAILDTPEEDFKKRAAAALYDIQKILDEQTVGFSVAFDYGQSGISAHPILVDMKNSNIEKPSE